MDTLYNCEKSLISGNSVQCLILIVKGALDKYNIIPNFFQISWDVYTIRNIGMGNDCMLGLGICAPGTQFIFSSGTRGFTKVGISG